MAFDKETTNQMINAVEEIAIPTMIAVVILLPPQKVSTKEFQPAFPFSRGVIVRVIVPSAHDESP